MSKVIKKFDPASHGAVTRAFDMAEVGEEGRKILASAQETARHILVRAAGEADVLKQKAYEKGLAEALKDARERHEAVIAEEVRRQRSAEVDALVKSLHDVIAQIDRERERLIRDSRREVVELAVMIARCVIKREVQCSDDVARLNLEEAIRLSARHSGLTVRVSESDMATLNRVLADTPSLLGLSERGAGESSVELVPSAEIMPGGCLVESASGEVDARIETQLREIERTLLGEEGRVR